MPKFVKYAVPQNTAEAEARFLVLEIRGLRVLLQLLGTNLPIPPTEVVALSDVVPTAEELEFLRVHEFAAE